MTRDPATIARELTRAQRHHLVMALQMTSGRDKDRYYLRLRVSGMVRRHLTDRGLLSRRFDSFLTKLGEQVRACLIADPNLMRRHPLPGRNHPVQRQGAKQ